MPVNYAKHMFIGFTYFFVAQKIRLHTLGKSALENDFECQFKIIDLLQFFVSSGLKPAGQTPAWICKTNFYSTLFILKHFPEHLTLWLF